MQTRRECGLRISVSLALTPLLTTPTTPMTNTAVTIVPNVSFLIIDLYCITCIYHDQKIHNFFLFCNLYFQIRFQLNPSQEINYLNT